jgi:hypothetical protein
LASIQEKATRIKKTNKKSPCQLGTFGGEDRGGKIKNEKKVVLA